MISAVRPGRQTVCTFPKKENPAFGLTARVTGGWRDETRPRNGQNSKPESTQFGGENPAVLVHAVLASTSKRNQLADAEKRSGANHGW